MSREQIRICATLYLVHGLICIGQAETVEINGRRLTVPDGFQVSLVAGPPQVMRPICADFDQHGDLYVADSSGSNENVHLQLQKKPHRIVRLRDTNADGVFDEANVFADRMMFPEGMLCHEGSIYVAAPPSIWKLTDTDGDGVADQRVEWFQGKTLTGCANDLHGPYAGPDGWIYWCKGAFAKQTHERNGGQIWSTRAAHIFRRRPTGGMIEPVMTGGMDNPVEVIFTPGGERVFTTTFLQHPAGGQRDGLIHAIYGGVYGKVHGVIDDHPRTGDVMPILTHLGAAAPCGLCRTESAGLGESIQGNIFSCLFNMHKVMRHELRQSGSTFETVDHDFLVSDDLDFHPTDVLEDADGSLIVIDTGGWYKLCCPTSQLQKPDVLGAIYRVRSRSVRPLADPRGQRIQWAHVGVDGLVRLLADPRPAVRHRAARKILANATEALPVLRQTLQNASDPQVRLAVVWTAVKIEGPDARALVRQALEDVDADVRQAAAHGVSVHRDPLARDRLERLLASTNDATAHNRRVAAEALGRLGRAESVPCLLNALRWAPDRVLEHSLTFALIEIGAAAPLQAALVDPHPAVRRAAMIALDQMKPNRLDPQNVMPLLASSQTRARETALWIVRQHPDWDAQLTAFAERQAESRPNDQAYQSLIQLVPNFAEESQFQSWLARAIADRQLPIGVRRNLLSAMAGCQLKKLPPAWARSLLRLLNDPASGLGTEAIETLVQLPRSEEADPQLNRALQDVASQPNVKSPLRLRAAAAVQGGWSPLPAELFAFLRGYLRSETSVTDRQLAVNTLAAARLTDDQFDQLLEDIHTAGPMELGPLLETYKQTGDRKIGLALVRTLRTAVSTSSLPPAILIERTQHFGPEVADDVQELLKDFEIDTAAQRRHLQQLLERLPDGDVRRGQQVFHSSKAACAACHAMGYLGGTIGPDLTHIGRIRQRRDLLEAIVFPSATFIRSYEPLTVITVDGEVFNGIVKDESELELTLVDTQRQEIRISRESIEEILPGKTSVMPSGLDQQLTLQELADLLAFLQDAK